MPAGFAKYTTAAVGPDQAFDYWRHLISDTFVPLTAEPVGAWTVSGSIGHAQFVGLDVSTVQAGGQHVRRTPRLIARGSDGYLLASIQTVGRGTVMQNGRAADLTPGTMAFYDSTRPYTLHFDESFEQIVVQMPLADAVAISGMRHLEGATARALSNAGAAGTVAAFFRSMAAVQRTDPAGAQRLAPAATMLLASALTMFEPGATPVDGGRQLRRTQAISVLQRRLHDPALDAGTVAAELHVSRRTLYRTFADEPDGVIGLLRRMRVDRAGKILRAHPSLPVEAVAASCGFAGEVQFHRVFRRLTGTTPAAFRSGDGTNR